MSASEDRLVARIRYGVLLRPVTKAVVCAALLVPALGRDPLLRVDRPVVLVLSLSCAVLLTVPVVRLRDRRGVLPDDHAWVADVLWLPVAVGWLGLLLAVLAVWPRWVGSATGAVVLELTAAALAGVLVGTARPRRDGDHDEQAPIPQPSGYAKSMGAAPRFEGTSIACSGGGIRAAAFCLGAMQRLRLRETGAGSLYDGADRVYAVSGGGYIATALHMARRHSSEDDDVQRTIFQPGSPEEDWLRRRSKFLLPTGSTRVTGVLSVLYGIAVNLALVGVVLYVVAYYVGWVQSRLTIICPRRPAGAPALCLTNGRDALMDTRTGGWFWYGWGLLVLGLAAFVVAKVSAKYLGRGRLMFAFATRVLVTVGLGVGALIIVLPWLVVVLNNATLGNEPTQTVARVMAASRLATPDGCLRRAELELTQQAELAWQRAPAKQRADSVPFSYGTCGHTWTDDAVVFAPGGDVVQRGHGQWCLPGQRLPHPTFCDDTVGASSSSLSDTLASWLAAVLALATAVRGLLKAGGTAAPATRRGALLDVFRRLVVPWAAGVLVAAVAFVVVLVLLRDNLVDPARLLDRTAILTVIAVFLGIRVLSDAVLSSIHPFYRERLSDAFLIRRSPSDPSTAEALPYRIPTHAWENQARTGPDLVVCCAANISDRDYVPAARGCAPFLFRTDAYATDPAFPGQRSAGAIGISDTRLPVGRMQDAQPYSATSDPKGLDTTLAAAMAASGAAFSPRVGRANARVRPYRMLLALANARLGVWLPNPYLTDPAARVSARPDGWREQLRWLWKRANKPGPFRVFKEAFGSLSVDDTRIYVTDGGHYDNTAIVEALRDRPRVLFALDASADAPDSLDALSDAIVTCRMDLGLVVRPAPETPADLVRHDPDHPVKLVTRGQSAATEVPALPRQAWLHLEVFTVADPTTVVSDIWFVKNVRTSEPNLELDGYAAENPAFPVTSTGNQFYGEYDFEAYRLLGYTNATHMLDAYAAAQRPPDDAAPPERQPLPPV